MLNPDYISPAVAIPLSLLLWAILLIMILRERSARKRLEEEVEADRELNYRRHTISKKPVELYDQDADAIKHLDYNTEKD